MSKYNKNKSIIDSDYVGMRNTPPPQKVQVIEIEENTRCMFGTEMYGGEGIPHLVVHVDDPDNVYKPGSSMIDGSQGRLGDVFKEDDRTVMASSDGDAYVFFTGWKGLAPYVVNFISLPDDASTMTLKEYAERNGQLAIASAPSIHGCYIKK